MTRPTLTVKQLMAKAEKATELSNWGDTRFTEPLSVYLDSVQASAGLSSAGSRMISQNVDRLLENRLLMHQRSTSNEGADVTSLPDPVFILGMPRTGSTLIHQLLACDPAARTIKYFEGLMPVNPSPNAGAKDRRIALAARQLSILNRLAPDLQRVHASYADAPEECLRIMEHSFADTMLEIRTKVPEYSAWLAQREFDPFYYQEFQRSLSVLGWDETHTHWVCKSPRHMLCLESLVAVFPECKVIWTHRDPTQTIPSFCSLVSVVQQVATDEVDPTYLGTFWLERIASGMQRASEFRKTDKPERYIDLPYESLLADPVRAVQEIYGHHSMTYTDVFDSSMKRWLIDHPKNKYGGHSYSPEQFGLSTATITDRFSDIEDWAQS